MRHDGLPRHNPRGLTRGPILIFDPYRLLKGHPAFPNLFPNLCCGTQRGREGETERQGFTQRALQAESVERRKAKETIGRSTLHHELEIIVLSTRHQVPTAAPGDNSLRSPGHSGLPAIPKTPEYHAREARERRSAKAPAARWLAEHNFFSTNPHQRNMTFVAHRVCGEFGGGNLVREILRSEIFEQHSDNGTPTPAQYFIFQLHGLALELFVYTPNFKSHQEAP